MFNLCLYDLYPIFQENNQGVKQGLCKIPITKKLIYNKITKHILTFLKLNTETHDHVQLYESAHWEWLVFLWPYWTPSEERQMAGDQVQQTAERPYWSSPLISYKDLPNYNNLMNNRYTKTAMRKVCGSCRSTSVESVHCLLVVCSCWMKR